MKSLFSSLFEGYTSKFKSKFVNQLRSVELAIKVLLLVCVGELLVILMMVNYVMKASTDRIIEITMTKDTLTDGEKYRISSTTASKSYFDSNAYAVLHELTTYDYSSIERKVNFVLGLVHPEKYEEVYESLRREADFAVKNRVTQVFDIKDWKYQQIDESTAEIKAIGILNRKVGGIAVIENKKYISSVIIRIRNGLPFVMGTSLNYEDREQLDREERLKVIDNYDRVDTEGIKNEKNKK